MISPAKTALTIAQKLQEESRQNTLCVRRPNVPLPQNAVRVQMASWPDSVRGVPNIFLRSALFGAIAKGKRHYAERLQLATFDSVHIFFTGQIFDQGDLDVYASLLHVMRGQRMGEQCRVTSYALLKLMGKGDTGKNRATLHRRLTRLQSGTVEIKQDNGVCYTGGLIGKALKEDETQQWLITLNPSLLALFARDQFTHVDWAMRRELDGKPLAQWLHGFYCSHAKPYPLRMETLLKLCGSQDGNPRSAQQTLRRALGVVSDASEAYGLKFRINVRGQLVCVEKAVRGAQQRHLAKRTQAPRKPHV